MLYHTSPEKIEKVSKFSGLFESFLCFSSKPYWLGGKRPDFTYEIDETSLNICQAGHIFYDENSTDNKELQSIVEEVMERCGVDEATAEGLIEESVNEWTEIDGCDADMSWWLQLQTAKAARALGYDGCQMTDEQGSVYFIDMYKKENLWTISEK